MTARPERQHRRAIGGLRLVREGSFNAPPDYPQVPFECPNPSAVVRFMQPYAEREEVEVFWILALDAQHRVIRNSPLVVTRGILNSALAHPREIFRLAIHVNAASIVAVHNHPSGDPTASHEDRVLTEQLVAAGETLGIPLRDHVILGAGRFVSFAELGLMKTLR